MAYFNPNRVDFNYNTNMIDAVGAVGRSLWDIYKENVTKNQNQMKIDEAKRSNLANEGINQNKLNETINYHNKDLELREKNLQATNDFRADQRNFWEWQKQEAERAKRDSIIQKQNEAAERQRIADQKAYQQDLEQDQLFTMLGGQYPQESQNWSSHQFRAYRNAYLSPQAIKDREAARKESGDVDPLKNLPIGIQGRLNNARTLLSRYVPYANDLASNESQISGGIDNMTAPIGKFLGLNSDTIAGLYADAEAIADLERAYTKGGGNQAKISAYNQINPVNTLFSTTVAGVGARIQNQINTYTEAINTLKSQGNYKGVQILEAELNDLIGQIPQQFTKFLDKNKQDTNAQDDIVNAFAEKKKRAQGKQLDYYETADEYGGYYKGANPLDEDF